MKKYLSLFALMCLFVGLSVNAQDLVNLSDCTDSQMAEVNNIFTQFTTDFQAVGTTSDNKTAIIDFDRLQRQWWDKTYQTLPKCTQAAEFGIKIGRVLDETMYILLLDAAKGDLGEDLSPPHTQAATELVNEVRDLLNISSSTSNATNATTTTYYVSGARTANIRACASSTCKIVSTAQSGTALEILDDSGDWYKVQLDNRDVGYVASSLVSSSMPPARPTQANKTNPKPTQMPVARPTDTLVPSSLSSTCPNLSATCSQLTCSQAYACLAAGNESLDRNNDGIPCESICSGG